MKNANPQSEQIQAEISALKREIAELSALLALKKVEAGHPSLRRLVQEIDKARAALKREAASVSQFSREHLGGITRSQVAKAAGRILLIGVIGYALSEAFGWVEHERKA